jgi:hypothetical protein
MSLLAGRDESALQGVIHADGGVRWREGVAGEYAILMTSADYSLKAMGQLYGDRADGVNSSKN